MSPVTGEGGSKPSPTKTDAGDQGGEKPGRGKLDVEGEFNVCPAAMVLITPATVQVGQSAVLIAEVFDPDSPNLTYAWMISEGELAEPDQNRTTYLCASAGDKALSLTVSDGDCADTVKTLLSCVDGL